jgi:hypothetical protein
VPASTQSIHDRFPILVARCISSARAAFSSHPVSEVTSVMNKQWPEHVPGSVIHDRIMKRKLIA